MTLRSSESSDSSRGDDHYNNRQQPYTESRRRDRAESTQPSHPPQASDHTKPYETVFNRIVEALRDRLSQSQDYDFTGCHFTVSLAGEESQFTRFNASKVRQSGLVCDGQLRLTLMTSDRTTSTNVPFTGDFLTDWAIAQEALSVLQAELPLLPEDPYVVVPTATDGEPEQNHSREVRTGRLLAEETVANTLLEPVRSLDFSGLYAGGTSYRAYGDSAGKQHWFEAPSFTLDYSLFTSPVGNTAGDTDSSAAKGTLAGAQWDSQAYTQNIAATKQQLARLTTPPKALPKGNYRTYLAPAAVADIIDTILWGGGLGEASLRQGNSAFGKLETGEKRLSEKFSLSEDFGRIGVPRFNSSGAIAPSQLAIIQNGQWANALINARSAKEYGKVSNAANTAESMRAPVVAPGDLKEADILTALGTGLYVSNLHYLNWSDLTAGRMTGMTRYACFWVENGKIIAPIKNLRFDDNLYRFLGEGLLALSEKQTFLPAVDTYERRSLGGMWMPGMLIDQFRYTL